MWQWFQKSFFRKTLSKNEIHDKRTLCILQRELVRIVEYATDSENKCLSIDESARLTLNFDPQRIHMTTSRFSYSIDKKHMYIALHGKCWAEILNEAIHVLSHLVNMGRDYALFRTIQDRIRRASQACSSMMPNLLLAKRIVAARRIQRAWRMCISNPAYHVCKNRLMSEFVRLEADM